MLIHKDLKIKKRSFGFWLRGISLALIICFLFQEISYAYPDIQKIDWNSAKKENFLSWARNILPAIPESVAHVDDAWKGSEEQKVILIQDAHTNNSCQLNTAKLLDRLKDVQYVFTEAAVRDASLSFLRKFGSKSERERIAKSYLAKGLLHGAEYLDLTSDLDFKIWGVENPELYKESVRAYAEVSKERPAFQEYLNQIEITVKTLKPALYNVFLRGFDEKVNRYRAEKMSLTDYFGILFTQSLVLKIDLKAYPYLEKLKAIQELESELDFKRANAELEEVMKFLSPEDQEELASKQQAMKLGSEEQVRIGFFLKLKEKITQPTPELGKYFDYLERINVLNKKELLLEQSKLEEEIYKRLIQNPDEENLYKTCKNLDSLKKLLNLTLTPDEYQDYKQRKEEFSIKTLTGFLNQKLMDLDRDHDKAVFLKDGYEPVIEHCEKFYELTYKRDQEFIKNIEAQKQQTSILITGGYHTPNLKTLLREKGISYIVLTPQITHETDQKRYEEILLSESIDGLTLPKPKLTITTNQSFNMTGYTNNVFAPAGSQAIVSEVQALGARLADGKIRTGFEGSVDIKGAPPVPKAQPLTPEERTQIMTGLREILSRGHLRGQSIYRQAVNLLNLFTDNHETSSDIQQARTLLDEFRTLEGARMADLFILNKFFPRSFNISQDAANQPTSNVFTFMKGNNSSPAVRMPEIDVTAFLTNLFESQFAKNANDLNGLKRGKTLAQTATLTSWSPINLSGFGAFPSALMQSLITTGMRFSSSGMDLAWVWHPFKAGTEATSIPSSSFSISTTPSNGRINSPRNSKYTISNNEAQTGTPVRRSSARQSVGGRLADGKADRGSWIVDGGQKSRIPALLAGRHNPQSTIHHPNAGARLAEKRKTLDREERIRALLRLIDSDLSQIKDLLDQHPEDFYKLNDTDDQLAVEVKNRLDWIYRNFNELRQSKQGKESIRLDDLFGLQRATHEFKLILWTLVQISQNKAHYRNGNGLAKGAGAGVVHHYDLDDKKIEVFIRWVRARNREARIRVKVINGRGYEASLRLDWHYSRNNQANLQLDLPDSLRHPSLFAKRYWHQVLTSLSDFKVFRDYAENLNRKLKNNHQGSRLASLSESEKKDRLEAILRTAQTTHETLLNWQVPYKVFPKTSAATRQFEADKDFAARYLDGEVTEETILQALRQASTLQNWSQIEEKLRYVVRRLELFKEVIHSMQSGMEDAYRQAAKPYSDQSSQRILTNVDSVLEELKSWEISSPRLENDFPHPDFRGDHGLPELDGARLASFEDRAFAQVLSVIKPQNQAVDIFLLQNPEENVERMKRALGGKIAYLPYAAYLIDHYYPNSGQVISVESLQDVLKLALPEPKKALARLLLQAISESPQLALAYIQFKKRRGFLRQVSGTLASQALGPLTGSAAEEAVRQIFGIGFDPLFEPRTEEGKRLLRMIIEDYRRRGHTLKYQTFQELLRISSVPHRDPDTGQIFMSTSIQDHRLLRGVLAAEIDSLLPDVRLPQLFEEFISILKIDPTAPINDQEILTLVRGILDLRPSYTATEMISGTLTESRFEVLVAGYRGRLQDPGLISNLQRVIDYYRQNYPEEPAELKSKENGKSQFDLENSENYVSFITKVYAALEETGRIAVGKSVFEIKIDERKNLQIYLAGHERPLRVFNPSQYKAIHISHEDETEQIEVSVSPSDLRIVLADAMNEVTAIRTKGVDFTRPLVAVLDLDGLGVGIQGFDEVILPMLQAELTRLAGSNEGRNTRILLHSKDSEATERLLKTLTDLDQNLGAYLFLNESDLQDYQSAPRIEISSKLKPGQKAFYFKPVSNGDIPNIGFMLKASNILGRLEELRMDDGALNSIFNALKKFTKNEDLNSGEFISLISGHNVTEAAFNLFALPEIIHLEIGQAIQAARLASKMILQAA